MSLLEVDLKQMEGVLNNTLQKCKEVAEQLEGNIEITEEVDTISDESYLFDKSADNIRDSVEVQLLLNDISKASSKIRDSYLEILATYSTLISVSGGDYEMLTLMKTLNNILKNEWRTYIKMTDTMLNSADFTPIHKVITSSNENN